MKWDVFLAEKQASDAATDRWQKIETATKSKLSLINQSEWPTYFNILQHTLPYTQLLQGLTRWCCPSATYILSFTQFEGVLRTGDVWLQMWPTMCPISLFQVQCSRIYLHLVTSLIFCCLKRSTRVSLSEMYYNESFEDSTDGKRDMWGYPHIWKVSALVMNAIIMSQDRTKKLFPTLESIFHICIDRRP